LIGG
jgi:3-methyladenine DNA glycosylase AlkD